MKTNWFTCQQVFFIKYEEREQQKITFKVSVSSCGLWFSGFFNFNIWWSDVVCFSLEMLLLLFHSGCSVVALLLFVLLQVDIFKCLWQTVILYYNVIYSDNVMCDAWKKERTVNSNSELQTKCKILSVRLVELGSSQCDSVDVCSCAAANIVIRLQHLTGAPDSN